MKYNKEELLDSLKTLTAEKEVLEMIIGLLAAELDKISFIEELERVKSL